MALQLYMGNSGSGKSHLLYEKITALSVKNKTGKFIILVPEQFTMQTQKQIVSMNQNKVMMNIDVLSFNRLAYRVFEELGCGKTPVIDEIGKTFIVRKAATQNKDRLNIYGSGLGKIGLVNEMKSLISEMLQYDIDEEKLDEMIKNNESDKLLCNKLKDMKIIFNAFNEYRKEKYITSEEILDVLYRNIEKSELLRGTTIVIDGFTGFTPIQRRLTEKLMMMSKDMYITISFDAAYRIHSSYPDYSLFYMSSVMLKDIERMAEHTQTKRLKDVIFKDNRRSSNAALLCLEKNIFRSKITPYAQSQEFINLSVCKNPLQEVLFAAGKINYLIREKKYRFSDIAVVTGDMEVYGVYIKYIFNKYKINCFVDQKAAVLNHPAASFLRCVMRVVSENFSYKSVMCFIRNEFSGISKDDADMLDNYLLAAGIDRKSKWSDKFIYQTRQTDVEKLEHLNELREEIYNKLLPFFNVFSKKTTTIVEKSTALFEFMLNFDLQNKIEKMAEGFEEHGDLSFAREYSQIYKVILNVMDSLVELLGDEKVSSKEYEKLLEAGFLEQKVGLIPPGGDEVVFGDIQRSRLSEIKALFVLGANDGIIPKHGDDAGILYDFDRKMLEEQGVMLSPGAREKYFNQKFYLYLNLTKPSEYLYLSFSKSNSTGESINSSYLVEEIFNIFPQIKIDDMEEKMLNADSVMCSNQGIDYIISNINRFNAMHQEDKEKFMMYYKYFAENGKEQMLDKLRAASKRKVYDDKIKASVAKALYGDVLEGSVTRFEQFAKCAYSHFLKYGLVLREREEAGFYSTDFGNIMHALLEKYFKLLKEKNISFDNEEEFVSDELIDACLEEIITEYGNIAIYATARDKYQITRMKRIAKRTLWALQKQFAAGKFSPQDLEVNFKTVQEISQNKDVKMAFKGRIDRVDVYETDDKVYVKVVDYKTGANSFNLLGVYYGTSLQLMLYLDEAVKITADKKKNKEKTVIPAAVLYYKIKDPFIEAEDIDEEAVDKEILSQLKVDGLISEKKEVLEAFDNNFSEVNESYSSYVVPVSTKKDGTIAAKSKTTLEEDFDIICRYAKRKASDIGMDIINGYVKPQPTLALDERICEFCDYHSICRFNPDISDIKETPKIAENLIVEAMKTVLSDGDDTDSKNKGEEENADVE